MSIWIVFVALCAGVGIAVQMPMTARVTERIGLLEGLLIVNLAGLAAVGLTMACRSSSLLTAWRSIPWYALAAGPLGIGVMAALAYAIPRIGVASALVLSIAAQLIVGLLLDRLGFLGLDVRSFELPRVIGAAVLILGAWLVVR